MNKFALSAVLVTALALGACVNTAGAPQIGVREGIGAVAGGTLGAVAGSQFGSGDGQLAATAIGAVLGAMIGREFGAQLDYVAQQRMQAATQQAATSGQRIAWETPRARGYSEPIRQGRTPSGSLCREVKMAVIIDGRTEEAYTTACQDTSGRWQIIT